MIIVNTFLFSSARIKVLNSGKGDHYEEQNNQKVFALALAVCMTTGSLISYQVQAAPEKMKMVSQRTDSTTAENYKIRGKKRL